MVKFIQCLTNGIGGHEFSLKCLLNAASINRSIHRTGKIHIGQC